MRLSKPLRSRTVRLIILSGWVNVAAALWAAVPTRFEFPAFTASYSADLGAGFDLGTAYSHDRPFFFSVKLPEGNYDVTVRLGGALACNTTVKAESRRLMLEGVETAANQYTTRTFTVNVRNFHLPPPPQNAPGGDQVRLNHREAGVLHWDDKLTLEFTGPHPCLTSLRIDKVDVPTVFLAGDSTVTDQPHEPTTSWGQMLPRFFKPGIAIANHAESGETLKSFVTGLRLDKILSELKKGDYLFIQFGHNDQKQNWPQTYSEAFTTYKQYLRTFIAEARLRGATPVLVTPMHRRTFDPNGKIRNSLGDYPDAVRQLAREENVALIDLNTMSAAFYEALGPEKSPVAFGANGSDATHHSAYGAYELARCVVNGIRAAHLDLAKYLADDASPFDPAHPDPPEAWAPAQPPPAPLKFDFSQIKPTDLYTPEKGYGFEAPAATAPPYYFSVRVPEEGNYKVTATFGDLGAATVTTVKAELRRLMIERVQTAPGEFVTRSFIVNVRRPQIDGGGEVRLKDREKTSEAWAWDDRITLEFTNSRPGVAKLEIEKAGAIPTLYIAGDSTSTDQGREPFNSWGQMLTRFFNSGIGVANHGESGESLRGFIGEHRLEKLMSMIRPGDYLLIQMGHNDQKERGEGVGAFTTYTRDLKRFIAEARQHGATPVLVTPMNRLTFDAEGKITNSLGDYPEAVRRAGKDENVPVIDLNAMSKPFYEALGPTGAHKAFAGNDTTHHSNYGSYELARCIVEAIRQARLPLAGYLVEGIAPFDPAYPDPLDKFDIPAETGAGPKPYGN
jgi:lysophospholipase L1-like esterase